MTDREIPVICRDCKYCHRYIEVGELTLYDWVPWKYECQAPYLQKDPRQYDLANGVEVCHAKQAKHA